MTTRRYDDAMRRALDLAANGPTAGGNPQVGCVLLGPDGTVVAEGWHHGAGTPHAEVDALARLAGASAATRPAEADALAKFAEVDSPARLAEADSPARLAEVNARAKPGSAAGLTAVVTLEPCNHTGRTGPCSEALIAAGVERVVYASSDPGEKSGKGAERLRSAGIDVIAGVLEAEANSFLERWLTATRRGTPWVTVKWAASVDGRAAAADGTSQWITGPASRRRVHEQRAESDAILIGTGTVLADDPNLTARGDNGELLPHQPLPVVMGKRAVPANAKLRERPFLELGRDLNRALRELHERDIRRVYVEGGPTLVSAFIAAGLVDDYVIYLAPKLIGGPGIAITDLGITSIDEARALTVTAVERLDDDILISARARHSTDTILQEAPRVYRNR